MYIRIFKSRKSSRAYTLNYAPSLDKDTPGKYFLTRDYPYDHETVQIPEIDLYNMLDTLFNEAKNEKENGKENGGKDD